MVNFSQWSCAMESEQPRVFRIDVGGAARFPWVLRQANAGFLEGVFSGLAQRSVLVSIEGEHPDPLRVPRARGAVDGDSRTPAWHSGGALHLTRGCGHAIDGSRA